MAASRLLFPSYPFRALRAISSLRPGPMPSGLPRTSTFCAPNLASKFGTHGGTQAGRGARFVASFPARAEEIAQLKGDSC